VVRRRGFVPFAVVPDLRRRRSAAILAPGGDGCSDGRTCQWLRRSFIAGFFVTVPLFISCAAILWLFRLVDGFVAPVVPEVSRPRARRARHRDYGAGDLLVGAIATNVVGKRLLQRAEWLLLHVPLFRSIYAPVKQLVVAFSPDNEYGFKRVVLDRGRSRGLLLGFLTQEFTVDRGQGPSLVAVYVPTNHLYLGDIVICPRIARRIPTSRWSRGSASS
jgi:uncharacterized membrane protein